MTEPDRQFDFDLAVVRYVDGSITPDQLAELNAALRDDTELRLEFTQRCAVLAELHEHHTAVADEAPRRRIQPSPPATPRRSNAIFPVALAAAVAIAAAVFTVYWFAQGPDPAPVQPSARPVATIIDATGAVLFNNDIANPGDEHGRGTYLTEAGSAALQLTSGATIELAGHTQLLVHGPMESTLTTGEATFECPPSAVGYTVHLPDGTSVIDLGTRFTVSINDDGQPRVRVGSGVVSVNVPGSGDQPNASYTLVAPDAVQIVDGRIQRVRTLDLADFVGGGDGTGTGADAGVRMSDGAATAAHRPGGDVFPANPVPAQHPFIDSVFVPDGGDGTVAVPIASTGLSVTGVPDSDGASWDELWNGHNVGVSTALAAEFETVIGMHCNKGVTFDLDAVRAVHGDSSIDRVTLAPAVGNIAVGGSILVYVDGDLRHRFTADVPNSSADVELDLGPDDRFLTIMAVQGARSGDWLFVGDPTLHLSERTSKKTETDPSRTLESDEISLDPGKESER